MASGGLVHGGQFLGQHELFLLRKVVFAMVFAADLALVDVRSQCVSNALWNYSFRMLRSEISL